MRHKYRAYDVDAGEFSYSDKESEYYCWGFEDGKLKAWAIVEKTPGDPMEAPYSDTEEIEPIEQFTGLRDKKRTDEYPEGQEVYEGDLVEFSSACYPTSPILGRKRIGEVFFKVAGSIDYCFRCIKDGNFGLNSNDVSCYEVIGNVHSDPELIENGTE